MSEEIFSKCYVDAHISRIFVNVLRKAGFTVQSSRELNNNRLNDEEQLDTAISLQSVFITLDKRTFLERSNALDKDHFGIIVIHRQLSKLQSAAAAELAIKKYLNHYTKDEFKNEIFYL